jgi:hypothetical protein
MGEASGSTVLVAFAGFVLSAILNTVSAFGVGGPSTATAVALYGVSAMAFLAAIFIAYVVSRLNPGPERNTWVLLGLGVLAGALADAVWESSASIGLMGITLNPGDPAYLVAYVLWAVAVVHWVLSSGFRSGLSRTVTESLVLTALLAALTWVTIVMPSLHSVGEMGPDVVDGLVWVVIDFPMLVLPTVFLLITLIRFRNEWLASPWVACAAAILLLVLGDIGWLWQVTHGGWQPGTVVDFAYMVSSVLFAASALATLDAQRAAATTERHSGSGF